MRLITAILTLLCLCGCYTEQKAVRKLAKVISKQPHVLASACATLYPPTDSVWTREVLIPGQTQWRHDTVGIDCDTVRTIVNGTRVVRIPCPPCPLRVDTFVREKHVTEVNTAKVVALEKQLRKADIAVAKVTQGRNTWRLIAIALMVLAAGYVVKKLVF